MPLILYVEQTFVTQRYMGLRGGRAFLLQRTTRERLLEYTEVSAVPAKIVDAKTSVEESPPAVQLTVSLHHHIQHIRMNSAWFLHSWLGDGHVLIIEE